MRSRDQYAVRIAEPSRPRVRDMFVAVSLALEQRSQRRIAAAPPGVELTEPGGARGGDDAASAV